MNWIRKLALIFVLSLTMSSHAVRNLWPYLLQRPTAVGNKRLEIVQVDTLEQELLASCCHRRRHPLPYLAHPFHKINDTALMERVKENCTFQK